MLSNHIKPGASKVLLRVVAIVASLSIFGVGGAICFILLRHNLKPIAPTQPKVSTSTSVPVTQTVAKVGLPVRLTIPSINVDAPIGYAGTAADGTMDISPSQDDVSWYEPGTRPGDIGSAVIAGHYGSLNGKWSVFSYLSKLHKGDQLRIKDHNGVIIKFAVRESRSYDPKADATDIFKSSDSKAHLNLITCEGTWNQTQKSYSDRLVVFADKLAN